ncbi:MAG TPA: type II toxin-antitoxin system VapC family toxin [Rhodocyclaceae bacterium]|nr:type II toxin-antitoxin system VapC family toxin [Rhodocyclaceae bacterium]
MRYLFDTNSVIYYFNGLTADASLHDLLKESFKISVITRIEFLGWGEFATNPALYDQARAFISHATLYDLTDEIVEQTIRLRQQFKTKTPDAIIAATALVNGLIVVTHNTGDFIRLGVKTLAITMKI